MNIRLATETDLPVINEIYNQAVSKGFCTAHLTPVSLSERKEWFEQHDPVRYPVYVAESDKQVKGWVSIGAYRSGRQALAQVAEVSYYVDKEEQGKGLGSLLLDHSIKSAPLHGHRVLIAILLNRNPASIALLEKYGFSRWGSMPGIAIINNETADHLYYGLHLQPQNSL